MNWRRITLLVILSAAGIAVSYLVFKLSGGWTFVADLCSRSLTCIYSSVITYLIVVKNDGTEKVEKPKKTKVKTSKAKTPKTKEAKSGKTKSGKTQK